MLRRLAGVSEPDAERSEAEGEREPAAETLSVFAKGPTVPVLPRRQTGSFHECLAEYEENVPSVPGSPGAQLLNDYPGS